MCNKVVVFGTAWYLLSNEVVQHIFKLLTLFNYDHFQIRVQYLEDRIVVGWDLPW